MGITLPRWVGVVATLVLSAYHPTMHVTPTSAPPLLQSFAANCRLLPHHYAIGTMPESPICSSAPAPAVSTVQLYVPYITGQ
jgi:hypothetical protein